MARRKRKKRKTINVPREYVTQYFSPDRQAIDHVVGFVERTGEQLDVAVYSITHPKVLTALVGSHERGVRVRVLVDKTQAAGRYSVVGDLERAGLDVIRDRKSGLMHHKYAISDGLAVLTGSFNWTRGADEKNYENFQILRIKKVIRAYQENFEEVWEENA